MVKGNAAPVQTHQKPWIDCPLCGSRTLLNVYPGEYAGIWECTNPACGASDTCEHEETELEEVTGYWPTQEQIDRGTDHDETWTISVCMACGVTVDDNVEPDYD